MNLLVPFVPGFGPKIRTDVGSCLPHTWGFIRDVCGDIWGGRRGEKSPARRAMECRSIRQGWVNARSGNAIGWLYQPQLRGTSDGRPAIVDAELAVDALRVGADGAQGDHELIGDLRAGELGPEQSQHFELAPA
jgi:hypothetical protein